MKTSLQLFCLWLIFQGPAALCQESITNRLAFRGVSTNEVVAFDDFQKALNGEDVAGALGIQHWNFQVQVPAGTETLHLRLHLVEGKAERDLGYVNLSARRQDNDGRTVPGLKQLRVLAMVIPVETTSANPLTESKKLKFHAKEFQSGSHSSMLIDNPFQKAGGGVSTFRTSRRLRDRPTPSGVWDGFGTRFDLMSMGSDKSVVRLSFEPGERSN